MVDLESRVQREREQYDKGLRRKTYQDLLTSHAAHFAAQQRQRLAHDALTAANPDRILEIGSTMWLHYLEDTNLTPSHTCCINISQKELDKGIRRSTGTRLKPEFRLMDAHRLEFPDDYFDVVFGQSILHHLELDTALREINRVLRPGGTFLFTEPLDNNPVGRVVRRLTPQARTEDEKPLRFADLALIRDSFDCDFHYQQLFSVPAGLVSRLVFDDPDNRLTRLAFRADRAVLARAPWVGPFFRNVTIVGRKRVAAAA